VEKLYVACRWNYHETSRHFLQDSVAHVSANGRTVLARPMDWGPNENTGRVADLSPGLAEALGLSTDDTCSVTVYASGK
jgi:rare lipoprotein A (peptidoglycan hydrolase)